MRLLGGSERAEWAKGRSGRLCSSSGGGAAGSGLLKACMNGFRDRTEIGEDIKLALAPEKIQRHPGLK